MPKECTMNVYCPELKCAPLTVLKLSPRSLHPSLTGTAWNPLQIQGKPGEKHGKLLAVGPNTQFLITNYYLIRVKPTI